MRKQYEYQTFTKTFRVEAIAKETPVLGWFNDLGAEGWLLVSAATETHGDSVDMSIVCAREVEHE